MDTLLVNILLGWHVVLVHDGEGMMLQRQRTKYPNILSAHRCHVLYFVFNSGSVALLACMFY